MDEITLQRIKKEIIFLSLSKLNLMEEIKVGEDSYTVERMSYTADDCIYVIIRDDMFNEHTIKIDLKV